MQVQNTAKEGEGKVYCRDLFRFRVLVFVNKIIPVSKALVEITDKSSDEEETLEVNNMLFQ